MTEFNKAINIEGVNYYFLNRSYCHFRMKDLARAREDALKAMSLGSPVTEAYKASIQLK